METIGNRIKILREQNNLTLRELANKINTSSPTIQRYESGVIENIPFEKIEELAKALNTTPSYLMGWDNENKQNITKEDKFIKLLIQKTLENKIKWIEYKDNQNKFIEFFKLSYNNDIFRFADIDNFMLLFSMNTEDFYLSYADVSNPKDYNIIYIYDNKNLFELKRVILDEEKTELNTLITKLENL